MPGKDFTTIGCKLPEGCQNAWQSLGDYSFLLALKAKSSTVAPMRGIYLQLKQFYSVHRKCFTLKKNQCRCLSVFNFHFSLTLALSLELIANIAKERPNPEEMVIALV
jgi:hypothetical protein